MSEHRVELDRRAALLLALGGAATIAIGTSGRARAAGEPTELAPGVTLRTIGEQPTQVPGFSKVVMYEVGFKPGSTLTDTMKSHWICRIEGAPLEVQKVGQPTRTVQPGEFYVCHPGEVETDVNRSEKTSVMTAFELVAA